MGENYLKDAAFENMSRRSKKRYWKISQHSSRRSFEYEIAEGTFTIRKTGHEPWFIVRQKVSAGDLAGKRLVFGVDLKLDLHSGEKDRDVKQGGGMTISARSRSEEPIESKLEHKTVLGTTDWQTEIIVLDMPEDLTSIQFGLLHQAEGTMQMRNPFIRIAPAEGCSPGSH